MGKNYIVLVMLLISSFSFGQNNCVYIAGFTRGMDGRQYAAYWKNGQLTKLTNGSDRDEARSIAVLGNDVHVVGFKMKGVDRAAAYWKNGQEVPLNLEGDYSSIKSTEAYAVKVAGNDVYIFVTQPDRRSNLDPKYYYYYKNGKAVKVLISDNELKEEFRGTSRGRTSESYFVSDNGDVYEAGTVADIDGDKKRVVYWKNGHRVVESASEKYPNNMTLNLNSIFVSNNGDVYIAGAKCFTNDHETDFAKAVYWKNGKEIAFPVEKGAAQATDICVQGNDVFVSGYQTKTFSHFSAIYWKNGQKITLAEDEGNETAKSITVVDGTVYVSGSHKGNLYWKNGKEIKLNEESGGQIWSMTVVKGGGCIDQGSNNLQTANNQNTLVTDENLAYTSLAAGALGAMSLINDQYTNKIASGKIQAGLGYEQTPMITNQTNPNAAPASYADKASYPLIYFGLNLEFLNNKPVNLSVRPNISIGIDAFSPETGGTHIATGIEGGLRFWYKTHTKFKLFADVGWFERVGDKTADSNAQNGTTTDEVKEGEYQYHVLRYGGGPMLHLRHDGRESWIKPGVYFEQFTFAKYDDPTMSFSLSVNIESEIILEASYSQNYPIAGTIKYPNTFTFANQDYFSIKIIRQGKLW